MPQFGKCFQLAVLGLMQIMLQLQKSRGQLGENLNQHRLRAPPRACDLFLFRLRAPPRASGMFLF